MSLCSCGSCAYLRVSRAGPDSWPRPVTSLKPKVFLRSEIPVGPALPTLALSPLPATLMAHSASVADKGLTVRLSLLDATLTKHREYHPSSQMRSLHPEWCYRKPYLFVCPFIRSLLRYLLTSLLPETAAP